MGWSLASSSPTLHLVPSTSASPSPPLLTSSLHIHSSRANQNQNQDPRLRAFPRRKLQPVQEEEYEDVVTGYKFPDPIPEFAQVEIEKFKAHLLKKFTNETKLYGDKAEEVAEVCTEIFSTFLHKEYGGPGTLLVMPFAEMAETIHGRGLPSGSKAARTAVKWAQKHVDADWKEWTKDDDNDDNDDNDNDGDGDDNEEDNDSD